VLSCATQNLRETCIKEAEINSGVDKVNDKEVRVNTKFDIFEFSFVVPDCARVAQQLFQITKFPASIAQ